MVRIKLKKIKKLENMITQFNSDILNELHKLKKEHAQIIIESQSDIISEICKGENLNESEIKKKYLKIKPKKEKIIDEDKTDSEQLLNHIVKDGNDYFYENKNNGNVFDNMNKHVGSYVSGTIIFR